MAMAMILQAPSPAAQGKNEQEMTKQSRQLMSKADKAMKNKEYDSALSLFQQVIDAQPELALAHMGKGVALRIQEKFEEAVQSFEKAIELKPDYQQAKQALAETLIFAGNKFGTEKQLEKANAHYLKWLELQGINKDPKVEVQVHYTMGVNYLNLKDAVKSAETFQKLINQPNLQKDFSQIYAVSHYMLGLGLGQMNKYEEAQENLIKYLELSQSDPANPFAPLANYMIGSSAYLALDEEVEKINTEIRGLNGELEKINNDSKIKDEDKIKSAKPVQDKIAEAQKRKAGLAVEKTGRIVPYLTKAIEGRADLEDAYVKLGNFYYLCEDWSGALKIYQTIMEKFPSSPDRSTYEKFMKTIEEKVKGKTQ